MEFKTSNAEYGQPWAGTAAPTFAQINENRAALRELKRELARERGEAAARLAPPPSAPPRAKPFEPSAYTVPESAFQLRSPLYSTSSGDYGRLAPAEADMPFRYAPKRSSFPEAVQPAARNGLNTTVTRSRVNDILDYYY